MMFSNVRKLGQIVTNSTKFCHMCFFSKLEIEHFAGFGEKISRSYQNPSNFSPPTKLPQKPFFFFFIYFLSSLFHPYQINPKIGIIIKQYVWVMQDKF